MGCILTRLWSRPQVAIRGTAVFGISALALVFSPRGCHVGETATLALSCLHVK